jgi:hypothetical protein
MALMAISGARPEGDCNGLAADEVVKGLLEDPRKLVMVVALVNADQITIKTRRGVQYPTVSLAWVEVVPADETEHVGQLMNQLYQERTGAMMAPFIVGQDRPMIETPFPEEEATE